MEKIMVGAATGVMNSLLRKLTTLLGNEYKLLEGVKRDIAFLRDELTSMNLFLFKLADIEDLDIQVKNRRDKVRELAYDIEDCIDHFMHNHNHSPRASLGLETVEKIRELWSRHGIGKQIQELKIRVMEESARHDRYRLDDSTSRPRALEPDQRVTALFAESNALCIDIPMEQIQRWLTGEEKSEQELKVISIVGFGGLGKTTLAIQAYNKLRDNFACAAFVSVSRNPSIQKVLMDILKAVGASIDTTDDVGQLINKLTGYLTKKRYLIVIDDLWDVPTWSIIKCAFYQNNYGSRIITTTCKTDVAMACCSSSYDHIYEMKPLGVVDSERLFFKIIFGSEECPRHLRKASNEILRKCGGVPLAIITISSFLASKALTLDQWNAVANSIGSALENNQNIKVMRKVLSISYFDLPHYLKTCLLYLSIFPKDYTIKRKNLIIRWIAEGFIQEEHGQNEHDIGESYFNELINRRLIQPVYVDPSSGQVESCKVHNMILDLIITKSVEENFVALLDTRKLTQNSQNNIRRLSIQCGDAKPAIALDGLVLSLVRSVSIFGHGKQVPCLSDMKALRVLDLECCNGLRDHQLANMEALIHLKYLNLGETEIREIPHSIGKLQYLDTLDIRNTWVRELPSAIVQLGQLTRLFVDLNTRLPDGIGNMKNLEELTHVNVCMYPMNFPKELARLTKLRELEISWDGDCVEREESNRLFAEDRLVLSLWQLATHNLHSLSLHIISDYRNGFPLEPCNLSFQLPHRLRRLHIDTKLGCISRVPNWIYWLGNLQELSLRVKKMNQTDFSALGLIPALRSLALYLEENPRHETWFVIRGAWFQNLKVFRFICEWMCLVFEDGSMRKLEIIELEFKYDSYTMEKLGFDFGINNLTCLTKASFKISVSEEKEAAIRKAVGNHCNRPIVEIIRTRFLNI
ncbi:Disease resistance protein RPM1 [Dichanthelium oligosanthes]|uniref:Disease resistance protein RPM1 n=1 Tax=Dichanthelium oligosanthes TaxID=888268 RepID=A0A1E5V666_9POAL|nr:Disease resistance protein RPM1 [Dichanthelium oligosanthes]